MSTKKVIFTTWNARPTMNVDVNKVYIGYIAIWFNRRRNKWSTVTFNKIYSFCHLVLNDLSHFSPWTRFPNTFEREGNVNTLANHIRHNSTFTVGLNRAFVCVYVPLDHDKVSTAIEFTHSSHTALSQLWSFFLMLLLKCYLYFSYLLFKLLNRSIRFMLFNRMCKTHLQYMAFIVFKHAFMWFVITFFCLFFSTFRLSSASLHCLRISNLFEIL